ncbi:MAG: DUF1343 domain-containing protein [Bacteroidota bacterium]|nr:DUF1343 domain-containing protein [Bacteroidota bacterium]
MKYLLFLISALFVFQACNTSGDDFTMGASRFDEYDHLLEGKKVGFVGNHTSMVGNIHLVDTLLSRGVEIIKIFGPEHGFWGGGNAGSVILDAKHPVHEIEIISLYGKKKKPSTDDMQGIEIMIFDLQDVGARFYTYISTLQYVMEACAENGTELIVLDRPNPNGFYVDGPVLDTAYKSFVGLTPIPLVHGMTIGEYALMLNGEGWLENDVTCDLHVVKCDNYSHDTYYKLPMKPSPNLPVMNSIYLYPSICLFEGTVFSCGRGTETPFQLYGHPDMPDTGFSFTPRPNEGASDSRFNGIKCYGTDLRNAMEEGLVPVPRLQLRWLIDAYNDFPDKENFFTSYITLLAGNEILKEQIISGMSEDEIRATWQDDLDKFIKIREKYLLYD